MQETDSIKALEQQAKNTKYLMDKLNRAAYGLTFDELVKEALSRGDEPDAEKDQ